MFSKILCFGMAVCDIIISPIPQNILSVDSCQIEVPVVSGGGDALNVAHVLAKLGVNVSLCTRISRDLMGETILDIINRAGVDTTAVVRDNKNPTAVSFVLIDEKGERHFASSKQIFQEISERDVSDDFLKKHDAVYFGSAMQMPEMDNGGISSLFRRAHSLNMPTFMDVAIAEEPGKPWRDILDEALSYTDYFIPSHAEAEAITGQSDPLLQARYFKKYNMQALVIKLGSKGCFVTDFVKENFIAPPNVRVVDTDGAGDSFAAGFICALSKGRGVFEAAGFATAAASLSVSGSGAIGSLQNYEHTLSFYNDNIIFNANQ